MREFTSAYYGTGTSFEVGSSFLQDPNAPLYLLKYLMDTHLINEQERKDFAGKFNTGHMTENVNQSSSAILEDLLKLTAQEVPVHQVIPLIHSLSIYLSSSIRF